jgi:hypothetical protein
MALDYHTLRLCVGLIALCLAPVVANLSGEELSAVSAAYHIDGPTSTVFVGSLFAVASFLVAYNGHTTVQAALSRVAAAAALLVAIIPCRCGRPASDGTEWHLIAAAVMFAILLYFCYAFAQCSAKKHGSRARLRTVMYWCCFAVMLSGMVLIAVSKLVPDLARDLTDRPVFVGEAMALSAFGAAWLIASQALRLLRDPVIR